MFMHKRSAFAKFGTAAPELIRAKTGINVEYGPVEWKHLYLMPLDAEMRVKTMALSKPYPKRVKQATVGYPLTSDGAAPIHSLQA